PAVLPHVGAPELRERSPQDLDGAAVTDHRAGASRPGRLMPTELLERAVGRGQRREVHPVPQQPFGALLLPDQRELLTEGGRAAELAQAGAGQRVVTGSVSARASAASWPLGRTDRTRPPRRNTSAQPT